MNYHNAAAAPGSVAQVKIGDRVFQSVDLHRPSGQRKLQAKSAAFNKELTDAIRAAGYPATADPAKMNRIMMVVILTILVIFVTMVYGPIAAMLVELFPTRIRYTGMSLPYHIGNGWFGGFLPPTAFAIVAATGDIFSGLWYPIAIAAMTFIIGIAVPAGDQGPGYLHLRKRAVTIVRASSSNREPAFRRGFFVFRE